MMDNRIHAQSDLRWLGQQWRRGYRFETSQPEVGLDPAGFLIARVGEQTLPASRSAFFDRLRGRWAAASARARQWAQGPG